jgi:hypothetical protein
MNQKEYGRKLLCLRLDKAKIVTFACKTVDETKTPATLAELPGRDLKEAGTLNIV